MNSYQKRWRTGQSGTLKKKIQFRILYPAKISFKNEDKIGIF